MSEKFSTPLGGSKFWLPGNPEALPGTRKVRTGKVRESQESQDSYYFVGCFFLVFVFLRGRPIGAGLRRRPRRVSSLVMNRSDRKGRP